MKTVKLISFESGFLESFIEWRCQSSSVRHNPLKPMSRADIAIMLESEGSDVSDLKKYSNYRWFVECDGIVVGSVSLKNISHMMNYAEIGYGIGEPHANAL